MLKWLLTIAIVYLVYRWYRTSQRSKKIEYDEQRKLSDDEYTDYEEVE
jgi:hypothetical protein